jgi:DNA-binding response OmpR family regulator
VPTVLLVEDELDMLTLLDSNLRSQGFETLLADTGERALAQLRARVPDLVLLDLMLPDVPGAELCRQIRSDPRTRAVPVVICTARTDEIDRVVGFELGADDYVTKPFSMRELVRLEQRARDGNAHARHAREEGAREARTGSRPARDRPRRRLPIRRSRPRELRPRLHARAQLQCRIITSMGPYRGFLNTA